MASKVCELPSRDLATIYQEERFPRRRALSGWRGLSKLNLLYNHVDLKPLLRSYFKKRNRDTRNSRAMV